MSFIKKIWTDPVWSKVIATAVLGVPALFFAYKSDLEKYLDIALSFVGTEIAISRGLFCFFALLTVLVIAVAVQRLFAKSSLPLEPWRSYVDDSFFGLNWHWEYSEKGAVKLIGAYCIQCNYQVLPELMGAYRAVARVGYHCDSCEQTVTTDEDSIANVESKVRRYVDRNRRTHWGKLHR